MEKETRKKEKFEAVEKKCRKHYDFIGDYFEREKATSFEVVMVCVRLIVSACYDNLVLPPISFEQALLQFINFHTKEFMPKKK